ncbi:MAG: hypothetical protein U1D25_18315 [Hydrogenophaga sp.]|nr:hypothetical protein [Hydrogenophaga sp.]MDZ4190040.1 hypothetical protein [Hydrogenophaga sp.]
MLNHLRYLELLWDALDPVMLDAFCPIQIVRFKRTKCPEVVDALPKNK